MSNRANYTFSQVPKADIPRSVFNRSHGHKTAFNAGLLIPIYVDEALPGDTFKMTANFFARLATPIYPIMDNLYVDTFFFAVPNRLVWDHWQEFCGEKKSPNDTNDYEVPTVTAPSGGFAIGSMFDYMGLPVHIDGIKANSLHMRAYNLIYNEWFRDQNLCDPVPVNTDDGPDDPADYQLKRRGKRHDYFTSCLPWPQKGPGVELPISGLAPVIPAGPDASPLLRVAGTNIQGHLQNPDLPYGNFTVPANFAGPDGKSATAADLWWADSGLVADLGSTQSVTINTMREAFQVQKLLERDARGGTRYVELLKSHFGVTSPDFRLQRPEFLGGHSMPIRINPVTQTSNTVDDSPQGNLAAYGTAAGGGIGFSKSFVEHCVIVGLVMIRADLSYQQGLHRMWSRKERFDFYWPAFAHLGEQAVLSKEIYAEGVPDDDTVFGYQERWAEYRYFPSKITGIMRSSEQGYPWQGLDAWHLAQNFKTRPLLNSTFIEENPPVDRVIAIKTEPHLLFDSHFELHCTRPMPTWSVPGLIDHF